MPEKCLPHASQLSDLSELSVSLAGASQHSCCNARISKAPMCQVPNLWAASCASFTSCRRLQGSALLSLSPGSDVPVSSRSSS